MVYGLNGIYAPNRVNWNSNIIEESYTSEDVKLISEELYNATISNDSVMIESIIGLNEGSTQLLTEAMSDVITKVKGLITKFVEKVKSIVRNFTKKIKGFFENIQDKYMAKQGYTEKVYKRTDNGDLYKEDYNFAILVGKDLDVSFKTFDGINSTSDIIDPFTEIASKLKSYCDMIKRVDLKMARISNSSAKGSMTYVDSGEQIEKCIDELADIEQKAKNLIDNEKKKFKEDSKIVEYDTITVQQAKLVQNVMQDNFEKKAIADLNQAQKDCEDDAKEYTSTLDDVVKGPKAPMDRDQQWSYGKISSEFNGYVQQVTRIMTYFTTASETMASSRISAIGKFVELMTTNAQSLARQKAKLLVDKGVITKMGYSNAASK